MLESSIYFIFIEAMHEGILIKFQVINICRVKPESLTLHPHMFKAEIPGGTWPSPEESS